MLRTILLVYFLASFVFSNKKSSDNNSNVECLSSTSRAEYRGRKSTTHSGYTCQQWILDFPHKKNDNSANPRNFPEKNLAAARNYCRNPDGESQPWCYTTNSSVRFEYCDIPLCVSSSTKNTSIDTNLVECLNSTSGIEYRGTKSTTHSGYTCQQWSSDFPHKKFNHSANPQNFPEKSLVAARNYCRNPDGGPRPWCYTTNPSVRFEYCDIPLCVSSSTNNTSIDTNPVECSNSTSGIDYRGTKSITESGYTCQQWILDSPHKKNFMAANPQNFPEKSLTAAKNYCRNPNGEVRPWCYTTDRLKRQDFCDIPLCEYHLDECLNSKDGIEYRGTKSTTQSGYTCQQWISDFPHKKNNMASNSQNFPEKSLSAAKNYCRNPDGEPRPWCYTTDTSKRHDFCEIPVCVKNFDECLNSEDGVDYRGTKSTTHSGYTCQQWILDSPHAKNHMATSPRNFPEKSLRAAKNYCRNPDGEPHPWCYTTDPSKRHDFCDIPMCSKHAGECLNSESGVEYRGTKSVTQLGYTCQDWISDIPHKKNYMATNPNNFPEKSLTLARNFCRNPDGEPRPWCYTTDVYKRKDFCDIPLCVKTATHLTTNNSVECLHSENGVEYKGTKSITEFGYTCQHWHLDTPHVKNDSATDPSNFPEKSLKAAENYCRNPNNQLRPWCYTTDPSMRLDYCDIPLCQMMES